jgi:4-hydroxy-2-oxoheptanedioate aldolase
MPFSPRTNRLRQCLAKGGPLIGFLPQVQTPDFVEYCGLLGFDWVFIDAEHTGLSAERCQELVRAADVVGLPSAIRLPTNDPALVLPYLETGVDAVIAPHIDDAEAARRLVRACRYFPKGTRGSSAGTRAANFGLTQTAGEYFAAERDHVIPIPLIEDREAFDHVAEIGAVDDVEVVFLGPGDLAMSMGLAGNARHPDVQKRIASALAYLVNAGKIVGTTASSPDDLRRLAAAGARMIMVGTGSLFAPAARQFLEAARSGQRSR